MFSDQLLDALGAWQTGWNEDQTRKALLAQTLKSAASDLKVKFLSVTRKCYRKLHIYKGELVDIVLNDERDEGIASWTIDFAYAEHFKKLPRPGAISGVIFEHVPEANEVIVNIGELWSSQEFIDAVDDYSLRGGSHARALLNFKNLQGEVVLSAPLRGSEIIALTGASSPFDELCEKASIREEDQDKIFRELVQSGVYPGDVGSTTPQGARNVIANTIRKMNEKLTAAGISMNINSGSDTACT